MAGLEKSPAEKDRCALPITVFSTLDRGEGREGVCKRLRQRDHPAGAFSGVQEIGAVWHRPLGAFDKLRSPHPLSRWTFRNEAQHVAREI